ncbi:MAG: FmdE family protein [Candidatus Brocadiia bacterium]
MAAQCYPRDLQRIVKFHGHFCGGITIGYRAAKAALQRLGARRAEDEEVVAIVENDSCAVDAVQVLTGCTFGKGNLFFRDHGKHVYTFALRPSGRAVRISRKPGLRLSPEAMLAAPAEELFWIEQTTIPLPVPARIHDSVVCERCGEPVMASRTRRRGERVLCIPCARRGRSIEPRPPLRRREADGNGADA